MTSQETTFQLLQEMRGHEEDVRGVSPCGEDRIATSSRDKTIKVWKKREEGYQIECTMVGHTDFVGPLAFIPPRISEYYAGGALVSGSRDKSLIVWDLNTMGILETLEGHKEQVSCIAISSSGTVVSGSLDGTLRIWDRSTCLTVLEGHAGPVLSAAFLPSGDLVSGSGDKTIKVWRDGRCMATLAGHTDTVRSICIFGNIGFLTASHDCTLRLWSFTGKEMLVMTGHTGLVYSLATLPGLDLVASGSEDNTVKIWNSKGKCIQTITHPSCVWDLGFLHDGNIVSACGDGVTRIWTQDASQLDADLVAAYNTALETQNKQVHGESGKVPMKDVSALSSPGSKDGQTIVVNEGGSGIAYSWDSVQMRWDKIGEVVRGPDDNMDVSAKMLDGVQYDYVFDVDIADGAPVRKLPYNIGQNPHTVAENWLAREGLPMSYREQVVEFILQNTTNTPQAPALHNPDPLTGNSAYIPQDVGAPKASHVPSKIDKLELNFAPMREFLHFDKMNHDGAAKKLHEIFGSSSNSTLDKEIIEDVLSLCADIGSSRPLRPEEIKQLQVAIECLDVQEMFPVLDMLRVAILNAQVAEHFASRSSLLSKVLKSVEDGASLPILLTVFRLVCNAFKFDSLRVWVKEEKATIINLAVQNLSLENKSYRLALATILLNFSTMAQQEDTSCGIECISLLIESLKSFDERDVDATFRLLVAVGTLACNKEDAAMCKALDVAEACCSAVALCGKPTKLVQALKDVETLLQ
mmetsp:Transcript_9394/g.57327  ORF Transcript_9394/g.57327 Transcript_9394/m.57327 type:complete len:750 (-) Transcript_9394:942-3191(-)|eukprot:CAMPEP_0183824596 /NCGR_PEP_ID=MMETSP0807_2-20130328/668_1 /TAXON_ID=88271 /ORGANISM="Picocystis salinarum, Strain CCMP1897" /LENGTH=749 /DNA_ID=CAMNT_0026069531 /DNA_START=19 /DNA_END=2268 /DNA_ORIENTATION=-